MSVASYLLLTDRCCSSKGDMSDEDDDNEFFDAPEIIMMPESMGHK